MRSALEWYERLLGAPPNSFPNEDEAVWQLADGGLVYVVADSARAGNGLVALIVDDLEDWVREVSGRGIPVGEVETLGGAVRKTVLVDPEGNRITVGQPLSAG